MTCWSTLASGSNPSTLTPGPSSAASHCHCLVVPGEVNAWRKPREAESGFISSRSLGSKPRTSVWSTASHARLRGGPKPGHKEEPQFSPRTRISPFPRQEKPYGSQREGAYDPISSVQRPGLPLPCCRLCLDTPAVLHPANDGTSSMCQRTGPRLDP